MNCGISYAIDQATYRSAVIPLGLRELLQAQHQYSQTLAFHPYLPPIFNDPHDPHDPHELDRKFTMFYL
jgi:hypothetical protein